ncbi:hypothetical protein ANCCAN_11678 [Ancylostoma caninum]|uniref:Uncharacterized protein n=1 Tax=Ancylostoma caninum TaxID=29170 RepID=A0A368GDC7_ANCCA|nr:hypothetical protein ANCCAN_11678 [Ancylostoma caninum]
MRSILLVAAVGAALPMATLTPKMLLTRKITQLVTGFLTDAQLSRAIDIAALDIHNGKRADEIMSDLYDYFTHTLDEVQLKAINQGYKAMVKDLGEEGAANAVERMKKVTAYAITPAVEQIRAEGQTPDLAYMAMSRQLTPDFVRIVVGLVRDTLTPNEWNSVKAHYGGMLRILENVQQPCVVNPSSW